MKVKIFSFCTLLITFLFLGNIGLHIFPTEVVNECEIQETKSYSIDGSQYIMTGEDPQIFANLKGEANGIEINLDEGLKQDTAIQLFLPDEQGGYSEELSYKVMGKQGQKSIKIDFPLGEYGKLRIDIDGSFHLDKICQIPVNQILAFADESTCYYVWSLCVLLAAVAMILVSHNSKVSSVYEDFYHRVTKLFQRIKKSQCTHRLLLGIGIAGLVGMLLEATVSLGRGKVFNRNEMFLLCFLCFVIYTMICMREWYKKKIEFMVCMLIIVCGLLFSTVMPVSVGISWDDEIHYLQSAKAARFLSGVVSEADQEFKKTYTNIIYNPEQGYSRKGQKEKIDEYDKIYDTGEFIEVDGSPIQMQSMGYIPAVVGMWISYGLFLSFSNSIILIRVVNVIFIGIIVYLSMKNVKSGKMLIPVFAFVPTVFFLASSFSYDTWLTMMLLYGFTRYFGELQEKDRVITWKSFLGIFIPLFLALPPKIVFAPLLFLTAYMPSKKFKERKWCYAYRACFILAAFVFVIGIYCIASGKIDLGTGDSRGGLVNPMEQMAYITGDLRGYGKMLFHFLTNYFSYSESANYLTFMAYAGKTNWQWFPIVLLFLVAFSDREPQVDKKTIPVLSKIQAIVVFWLMGAICATVMYLAFTPVGYNEINGCQGRYILPAVFPMIYAISRWGGKVVLRGKVKQEYYNMTVVLGSVVFLTCNLWVNIISKY